MRVLLSAYACEPGKGSEAGVGWNSLRQVARYHDVWVLTRMETVRPLKVFCRENRCRAFISSTSTCPAGFPSGRRDNVAFGSTTACGKPTPIL